MKYFLKDYNSYCYLVELDNDGYIISTLKLREHDHDSFKMPKPDLVDAYFQIDNHPTCRFNAWELK